MGEVKTSVGRLVWGHPMKAQQKRDQNKQPILKDGVPVMQWAFGVAFPKQAFQGEVWPVMAAEAQKIFPNGVPNGFAWKYQDGDGVDTDGKPFNQREGYAGCFVLSITTSAFAPSCYKWNPARGVYDQLGEADLKCGDFVAVALNIVGHVAKERTHNPGLYINPQAIELVGYGTAIINGPDAMTLFGGRQHALPPGASAVPVGAPAGVGMPTGGAAGMPQGQPMDMQQQPVQQYQQPQQVQPAYDYVQQTTGQQYPPQPMGMPQGQPMGGAPMMQPAQQPQYQQQPMQMQGNGQMPGQMPQGGLPGMPR